MVALPVWKLSVDSHKPKRAPYTRSRSPYNLLRVHTRRSGLSSGGHAHCENQKASALTEATGWLGRVYMMALPVWKLSVDG